MSQNKQGSKGLEGLVALSVPPTQETDVNALVNLLQALPEYAVVEQVQEVKAEIALKDTQIQELLGSETFDALKQRISKVQADLTIRKANLKNAALNDPSITVIRNTILGVQRLTDYLEKSAQDTLNLIPDYVEARQELAREVAKANRVQELRNAKSSLELEVRALLSSVNL